MTDQETLEFYDKLVEYYNGSVPHPEHQPIQFAYYVKLYKYYMERKNG